MNLPRSRLLAAGSVLGVTVAVGALAMSPMARAQEAPGVTRPVAAVPDVGPPPGAPPAPNRLSLGAILVTNSPSWSGLFQRAPTAGGLVVAVLPGSGAHVAGIVPGDVVVAIDDVTVSGSDRATFLLRSSEGGHHVVTVSRADGTARAVDVELGPPKSVAGHLRKQLAQSGDPVTRYLYAQTSSDPAEAVGVVDQVIRIVPTFGPAHALMAQKLFDGARQRGGGTPELLSAITSELSRGIEVDADSAEVRVAAARIYSALGLRPEAEAAALAAVERDPGSAAAHSLLGLSRFALGRPNEALPDLRLAVDLDPYAPEHYAELGRLYTALGQPESSAATVKALQALAALSRSDARSGRSAASVALAIMVLAGLGVATVLALGRRLPVPDGPVESAEPRTDPAVGMTEVLGALALWAIAIPLISPALGLAPETTRRLEIADHVVPGVLALLAAAIGLSLLLRNGNARQDLLILVPVAGFLAGFWMSATHFPLVLQAFRHDRPWSLALFHSSAGPPIIAVSVWLYAVLSRAERADAAEVPHLAKVPS